MTTNTTNTLKRALREGRAQIGLWSSLSSHVTVEVIAGAGFDWLLLDTELRLEVFNVLNHPQFAQPNGQLGNAAFGTISAMLASPSCALCGTTERQMQMAVKVKF